ncbi:MAG: hypothetical protein JW750_07025 [Anaerolineaceae bacterium]|nr:hypothetical protein [Anaerolineaceae bacterium]
MFCGEFKRHLDVKGRVMVPAEYRDAIGETFYLTQGFDRNLMVLPVKMWQKMVKNIRGLNIYDRNARLLRRIFITKSYEVTLDKASRFRIPGELTDLVGIQPGNSIIIAGNGDYLEIWSQDGWEAENLTMSDPLINEERFKNFTMVLNDFDDEESAEE